MLEYLGTCSDTGRIPGPDDRAITDKGMSLDSTSHRGSKEGNFEGLLYLALRSLPMAMGSFYTNHTGGNTERPKLYHFVLASLVLFKKRFADEVETLKISVINFLGSCDN